MDTNISEFKFPDRIKEKIEKRLNPALIKTRDVGGKSMRYIAGSTVVDILNNAFDYMWDWISDREWIEQGVPFFNKYWKDETGKVVGRLEDQGPVAHVKGHLVINFYDDNSILHTITKSGYGSKCIIGKQSEQDSIFKAAETDALKKAASRLGIGAELYRSEEENAIFEMSKDPTAWTDEMLNKYAKALDYISNTMGSLNPKDQMSVIEQFGYGCHTLEDINPTNIDNFVSYLIDLEKQGEEAS